MVALPRLCSLIVILLFLSAFFSAIEMALNVTSRTKLDALAEEHPFLKRAVSWVNADRYKVLSAILIGNNLVNIAASSTVTAISVILWRHQGVVYSVIAMTVLIIIFGEVLPKCVAMAQSERLLILALPLLRLWGLLLEPAIWCMSKFAYCVGRIIGLDLSLKDSSVTKEEIGQVVKIGEASGAIEESERQMIDGVISFDETRVSEIMVPRTSMIMLSFDATVDESLLFMQQKGVSRMPVYNETPDHIVGIVLVKDLISAFSTGKGQEQIITFARKPLFVPQTLYVPELFKIMKNVRMHMAVVVDEYGGTAGLLTMEDLLEEIVGDIQDEYDKDEHTFTPQKDGSFRIKATITLDELNEILSTNFECEDADTLGGLLLERFGNFPKQGDSVVIDEWTFTVSSMGEHRILSVTAKKNDLDDNGGSSAE